MNSLQELRSSLLQALNGGYVWAYFVTDEVAQQTAPVVDPSKRKVREKDLRKAFAEWKAGKIGLESPLKDVNRFYRTRFDNKHIGALAGSLHEVLSTFDFLTANLCEDEDAPRVCETVITSVIQRLKAKVPDADRPYSLTTKFMHFYRPELFPICDRQANASWIAITRKLGLRSFAYSKWGYPDGTGYHEVCNFYRELVRQLDFRKGDEMSGLVNRIAQTFGFDFGILDSLDKFCWMAAGKEKCLFGYTAPHRRSPNS